MNWKTLHRWLGVLAGFFVLISAASGLFLTIDPLQQAWRTPTIPRDTTAATLVERISHHIDGIEEIRRLPSGSIVVYSFTKDAARAQRVDPGSGAVLGPYRPSALPRWVKNLHRTLLLGDAGRWGAAAIALTMLILSVSGLVLLLRRMGGWRHLAGTVRGSLMQRLHVQSGRLVLVVLLLSTLTGLYMSATTLEWIPLDSEPEPDILSQVNQPTLAPGQIPFLGTLPLSQLRKLSFPDEDDPEDSWRITTTQGSGWFERHSGQQLAWQDAQATQKLYDAALMLHAGEGAWWPWTILLGLGAASLPLFWLSGLSIWWCTRRAQPRQRNRHALPQADVLIFVASEGGSTWGFAEALRAALERNGHRVHSTGLEHFHLAPATRQVFVLAATHGEGQAPAHAVPALARIAGCAPRSAAKPVPVTVLGFGDRQFPAFCAYAEAVDRTLRAHGWPQLLPLECIHRQSAQHFLLWGEALSKALGEALILDYRPQHPPTSTLALVSRETYPGGAGQPAVILRFVWPKSTFLARLRGHGLGTFEAGDLIGIVPPGSSLPRYYSLASGAADGFVEICVRRIPGGLCSTHLFDLKPGQTIAAFVRPNPGFGLPSGRRPIILIGAGTGVAPLAGFIRRNTRRIPMHLYFGARDPALDHYFGQAIETWRQSGQVSSVHTVFSRLPGGGGYVQNALQSDAEKLRELLMKGAIVRVCGSRAMAQGVRETLDAILSGLHSSVQKLREQDRYAEDVF